MSLTAMELRITHSLPGRVRVHVPSNLGLDPGRIEARLRQIAGVYRAVYTPLTANVLIHFDATALDTATLLAAIGGTALSAADPRLSALPSDGTAPTPSMRAGQADRRRRAEPGTPSSLAIGPSHRPTRPEQRRAPAAAQERGSLHAVGHVATRVLEMAAAVIGKLDDIPFARSGLSVLIGPVATNVLFGVVGVLNLARSARQAASFARAAVQPRPNMGAARAPAVAPVERRCQHPGQEQQRARVPAGRRPTQRTQSASSPAHLAWPA
jgi:hypothetical protein